jgi:pimeloyl-ACP methyl ester carboxylesterase
MGPGFHSAVEREWLSEFPIEYWDQPISHGPRAFSELVESTRSKIDEMHRAAGQRIRVVAHCFGVQVMTALFPDLEAAIGDCLFLSASRPRLGFHHFLKKLSKEPRVTADIREKLSDYLKTTPNPSVESFSSTIGMLLQVPDFMRFYWANQMLYGKYVQTCSRHAALDLNMFSDVMSEFLPLEFTAPRTTARDRSIEFLFGSENPFVEFEAERDYWRQLFPTASFELVPDVGHNVHLELKWFKGRMKTWLGS